MAGRLHRRQGMRAALFMTSALSAVLLSAGPDMGRLQPRGRVAERRHLHGLYPGPYCRRHHARRYHRHHVRRLEHCLGRRGPVRR